MPRYYPILDNGASPGDDGMSYEEAFGSAVNSRLQRKRGKKKAAAKKKPVARKKSVPKNSTGNDQPVRVGRTSPTPTRTSPAPTMKLQYIISEARGLYPVKPKKVKDRRSAAQRIVEAQRRK